MAAPKVPCPTCGRPRDPRAAQCRICFRTARDALTVKTCTGCSTEYPVEEFNWRPDGRGGHKRRSRCKACESAAAAASRKANPAKHDAAKRKWEQANPETHRRYLMRRAARVLGLDSADILAYYDAHDGRCEVCGRTAAEATKKFSRLTIDHDHATGRFRGLLCSPCNLAAGLAQDSAARLRALAAYLEK